MSDSIPVESAIKGNNVILNVNDDDAARYITTRILQKEGFVVVEAINGTEALRLARDLPSLVVLDVNMPDINGVEVCRRLKADVMTMSIPVLHLSANRIGKDDKLLGLESGADGYLTQPVEPAELTATVRALLRLTRAEEKVRSAAQEWQAVFDAVRDGICLLNGDGDIQQFNRAFSDMLDIGNSELAGKPFDKIMAQAFGEEPGFWGNLLDRSAHSAVELPPKKGRWFQITQQPITSSTAGHPAGVVYILTDITQSKEAANRQRAFLRDVLASVTEGKLCLCNSREELPDHLPETMGKPVSLTKSSIRQLRKQVIEAATRQQFPIERKQDLETAIGEAAMNAVVHAKNATGEIRYSDTEEGWVQVWVEDHGEGIAVDSLHRATLERGFSSAGTLGHGFWLMLQIVDRVWLLTGAEGTTVVLEQQRQSPTAPTWLKSRQ